ncbi:MAG: PilZ domain-containing protein [Pelagimonas sp.]|jgi:hypothetical protein|nr:PilZ domain-containing protein [Pelagimonas sp.]
MFKQRADRWPSAWSLELHGETGKAPVQIRNVSVSGMAYVGGPSLRVGDQVSLLAMQQEVRAHVVRLEEGGGALEFTQTLSPAQLNNLRQFRSQATPW